MWPKRNLQTLGSPTEVNMSGSHPWGRTERYLPGDTPGLWNSLCSLGWRLRGRPREEEGRIRDCNTWQQTPRDTRLTVFPLQRHHQPFCLGCSCRCATLLLKPRVIRPAIRGKMREGAKRSRWAGENPCFSVFPGMVECLPTTSPFPFHFQYYRHFLLTYRINATTPELRACHKKKFYDSWGVRPLYQSQNV